MNHDMNLNPDAFEAIKAGKKTREYRLYDEKRRRINIGDTIKFHKLSDSYDAVIVEVTGLLIYKDWRSCYEEFFVQDLSEYYDNIDQAILDTYENWWPKEKEEKYGCLIIKMRLVERNNVKLETKGTVDLDTLIN